MSTRRCSLQEFHQRNLEVYSGETGCERSIPLIAFGVLLCLIIFAIFY